MHGTCIPQNAQFKEIFIIQMIVIYKYIHTF